METHKQWLLISGEPWTRYRTRLDLLSQAEDDPVVQFERAQMLAHPQVQGLISLASCFAERPIKRHNDASHPIYALVDLFGFAHPEAYGRVGRWITWGCDELALPAWPKI